MNKELQNIISLYVENEFYLDSIVVTSFIKNNTIKVPNGILANYFNSNVPIFDIKTIEDVINVFELTIPKAEKTKNGAVYTPKHIRDYIIEGVVTKQKRSLQDCFIIDIACGCGAFLYSFAEYMRIQHGQTYRKTMQHLYGVDVSEISVKRSVILLSLAALQNGEMLNETDFHICLGNSLNFNFSAIPEVSANGGFDIVIGNPPYVRAKHIDEESKAMLSKWQVTRCGNADLYLPFFEIAYKILRKDGILGYITLNSFFKSVNARLLRNYFRLNAVALEIIDFGNQLVFNKKLAYTCIAFIDKNGKPGIHYTKGDIDTNGFTDKPGAFNFIPYNDLDDYNGWNLNNANILNNIRKIENAGIPLGEMFQIKNGIATLANDVYIFRPVRENETYFYLQTNGMEFPIEKGICKDIIKPNILHSEDEIADILEKVIFPYDDNNKILIEAVLMSKYPKAYKYLSLNRMKLAKRDNGEKVYEAWYAFGRSQATRDRGRKLLFPYMTDRPHFVYTNNENMLIYCGYAIFSENEEDLLVLKRILESSVFDYYIQHTSKPYATGYYSYAKNYVKGFGIPVLNQKQRNSLLSLEDGDAINRYVEQLYDL